jgi:hypothetical protein
VLEDENFKHWLCSNDSQLLWIKGDPGKGKTMLLCGIINELGASTRLTDPTSSTLLSYFFCQATDSRINNVRAVLRGLIYMLVQQEPKLISPLREQYQQAGKQLFEDVNSWTALVDIFSSMLEDPNLQNAYLIVDALDECDAAYISQAGGQAIQPGLSFTELSKLLDLIAQKSNIRGVKWIVSSRNWPSIKEQLDVVSQGARLSLELNHECVSAAVGIFIRHKLDALASKKNYDRETREAVHQYLLRNAAGTFLWVALVCKELAKVTARKALKQLTVFPQGLDALYARMMEQIRNMNDEEDIRLCQHILAITSVVYRPVTIEELTSFVELPGSAYGCDDTVKEIIGLCGSFLLLRKRTILFVHHSAKDFLLQSAPHNVFRSEIANMHYVIFSQSLQAMSVLHRDIYKLQDPGFPIVRVKQPAPDPLATARYSCVYWVDHLHDSGVENIGKEDFHDEGPIGKFLRQKYLYWLEALSLLGRMPHGVSAIVKLEGLLQVR